ncbi:hypothetical protein ALC57_09186 [Trachymyrmex cornetzi]|uniref:Uncharacterized protein n=1 Tax=Trachymyrmex cornetzi TaxID=471704 RepID=A0A195E080_9HYME|nr:hypothetical protein ALC57_09186 [Trachymyrmex cornetzi]
MSSSFKVVSSVITGAGLLFTSTTKNSSSKEFCGRFGPLTSPFNCHGLSKKSVYFMYFSMLSPSSSSETSLNKSNDSSSDPALSFPCFSFLSSLVKYSFSSCNLKNLSSTIEDFFLYFLFELFLISTSSSSDSFSSGSGFLELTGIVNFLSSDKTEMSLKMYAISLSFCNSNCCQICSSSKPSMTNSGNAFVFV